MYDTTALKSDPAAGTDKRLHGTEEVKKAGRPKGSTKAAAAARAAASTAAADATAAALATQRRQQGGVPFLRERMQKP